VNIYRNTGDEIYGVGGGKKLAHSEGCTILRKFYAMLQGARHASNVEPESSCALVLRELVGKHVWTAYI
jgi:hypothetical protein